MYASVDVMRRYTATRPFAASAGNDPDARMIRWIVSDCRVIVVPEGIVIACPAAYRTMMSPSVRLFGAETAGFTGAMSTYVVPAVIAVTRRTPSAIFTYRDVSSGSR
jgi:hypothetical protein